MLGTTERPLRVAIVGSGPSGFYAADALFKSGVACHVDMFEKLPSPYGLARTGVAPDHAKIREITKFFEKIAGHPNFSFHGNLEIGKALSVALLRKYYDAVILACGTEISQRMGIPGEELPGSYTAASFVGWYNGHPDHCEFPFDLSSEVAAVVGVGNVAIDVARILSKTVDELKHTDISQRALDILAQSRVKEVHVFGRRGPAQAKFRDQELKELTKLADCNCIVHPEDLALNPGSLQEMEDAGVRRNITYLRELAARTPDPSKRRNIHLRFLLSPVRVQGSGRVESLVMEKNQLHGAPFGQSAKGTGEIVQIPCGVLFSSIGYRAIPVPGVPFESRLGIIANHEGRVVDDGHVVSGLYTVGWIKRGPSGLIGSNKPCSHETVQKLLEDLPGLPPCQAPNTPALLEELKSNGARPVSFADWRIIDHEERARGAQVGKPRERFTRVNEMLALLDTEK